MIIMGIDPGFAITGYGIIEYNNNRFKVLDYGAITTESDLKLSERLLVLNDRLEELISLYNPDVVSIRNLNTFKNQKIR